MFNIEDLQKKATELRLKTIQAIHNAKVGHPGGSLSVMDILVTLYYADMHGQPIMKYDPKKPGWEDQDYLVLSKGHAAPALYTILADLGFFDSDELNYLSKLNAMLESTPNQKIPGITVATGSHGHGFAKAHGMAMALKLDRKPNKVFAVLSDAELQNGLVWETALAAAQFKSDNLYTFIDYNEFQADGTTRSIMNVDPLAEKFESFGWRVFKVLNGHNYDDILTALDKSFSNARKPTVIICKTIKGKGVTFAERKAGYHNVPFSDAEMKEAVTDLENTLKELNTTT
jgi:transketolase